MTLLKTPEQDAAGFRPPERWALIGLGVALAVCAAVFWIWPVQHTKAAPSGTQCTDPAKCVIKVDDAPETLLTCVLALGLVLVVIGVNGRRITTFKAANVEIDMDKLHEAANAATTEKAKAPGKTPTRLTPAQLKMAQQLAAWEAQAKAYEAQSAGRLSSVELHRIVDEASSHALKLTSEVD
jgi:hypothetical protein